jgi:uncharacterized SAM-binding protein YcdF (DUF218 family)
MFLLLSKALDLLAAPLTWALLLALPSVIGQERRPGRARALLALGMAQLLVFSCEIVSSRLFASLEHGAQSSYRAEESYDAVVVLGGILDAGAQTSGELEVNEAAERILRAADLLRAERARFVLLSGGIAFPRPGELPEAEILARWLAGQGIARERMVVEPRSRNTRENAVESAAIIRSRGWRKVLVITSAWHAPRALGCFRAVGLDPDVLPVDFRAGRAPPLGWLPRASALSASTDALREALGRIVYRLVGYSRAAAGEVESTRP